MSPDQEAILYCPSLLDSIAVSIFADIYIYIGWVNKYCIYTNQHLSTQPIYLQILRRQYCPRVGNPIPHPHPQKNDFLFHIPIVAHLFDMRQNYQKWATEVAIDKQQPIWKIEITNLSKALAKATANEFLIISRFSLRIDSIATTTTGTILQDHHPRGGVQSEDWRMKVRRLLAAPQTPKLPPLLPLSLVTSRPTSAYYVSNSIPWICSLKNSMKS